MRPHSRTKTCCPHLPKGRCGRGVTYTGRASHTLLALCLEFPHRRSVALSAGLCHRCRLGVAFDDAYMTMNTVSPSFSGSHVQGTADGRSVSRARSVRIQSSTRPPTFSTSTVRSMLCHAVRLCQEQGPSVPFLVRLLPAWRTPCHVLRGSTLVIQRDPSRIDVASCPTTR